MKHRASPRLSSLLAALSFCTALAVPTVCLAADEGKPSNFLYDPLEEAGGAKQPVFPLGALDAWGSVIDGESVRLQQVKSGGALDDSGVRKRDELVGVQVGRQYVSFTENPKEYLRALGEGIDAGLKTGGLQAKVRLGRDAGFTKVALPRLGLFVPGHVIDKMTTEGHENKNEFFFNHCAKWLAKANKAGKIQPGATISPGVAFAGLALLCGPDGEQDAMVGQWVKAIQADWAKPERKPAVSSSGDQDSYGCLLYSEGWRILLMSEYNWRHPDYARKAVLEKACDEMAQCLLNPSYLYKEPSFRKHDKGTEDPRIPKKEYTKDVFAYVTASTPRFPSFHGPAQPVGWRPNPRDLAMAWWCWSNCAETSGVQVNPKALNVARQYLLDLTMPANDKGVRAFPRNKNGSYSFPMDRETAACFANALIHSKNAEEAKIGMALATFVHQSPLTLISEQSEFGLMATCCLWLKAEGPAGYKARFNEWRWYLALMMQSDGDAHYCKLVTGLPYWEVSPLGDKEVLARGIAAFLLAAPARQLNLLGAKKPLQRQVSTQ